MPKMDISVVDDERVIGQTLGMILRNAGYRVEVFEDPHNALLSMHRAPRLLLTDDNMPQLSDAHLLRFLPRRNQRSPFCSSPCACGGRFAMAGAEPAGSRKPPAAQAGASDPHAR